MFYFTLNLRPQQKSKVINNILVDIDERILKVFDLERGIHIGDSKGHSLWKSESDFASYSNSDSGNELLSLHSKEKSKSNSSIYNDSGKLLLFNFDNL